MNYKVGLQQRFSMAGLIEVARRAGVSITTASRVLNGVDYPVAAATRRRVLRAADELSYAPSALARALVTRRSKMIGVLVGDIADPYFAEIARGIEDIARDEGYLVVICNTDRDPATERRYVSTLSEYRAEALILVGGEGTDPADQRAMARLFAAMGPRKTVMLALAGSRTGLAAIDIDHESAAGDMTQHLLELGHRAVGYIGGPRGVVTARAREAGFREALRAAGLTPAITREGDFTYAGGLNAARGILEQRLETRITAIFAANDQMALGALAAAREAGIRVPNDLSIVGFGDTAAAEQAVPPLTTVRIPSHKLGETAMRACLKAIEANGEVPIEPQLLPYRIVVRASSGAHANPDGTKKGH
jgi:LacI family transcriptional regulator